MAKVSIIIPVYNVKRYLQPCVDSVLAQTLQDIEVICVDDGSSDGSDKILDDYAKRDARVKVIHKENAGYGVAMNTGIRAATGEYIGIVESDDVVLPNMYEELYKHAKQDDLDIVKSDAFYWLETHNFQVRIHIKALDDFYDRVLTEENRDVFFQFYMNTWTGIYKRSFLLENDIWHSATPGASYQDNGFWIQTMTLCKNAKWLNEAFYLYRQDNPMASVKSKDKVYAMKNEYTHVEEILRKKVSEDSLEYCLYYRALRNKGTFMRIADELKREFCDTIIEDYTHYKKLIEKNSALNLWYQQVVDTPDEYCNQFIKEKQELESTLQSEPSIFIYGAGVYGKYVFRNLVNLGLADKILCFVTSKKETVSYVGDKEVKCIQEVEEQLKNALVILASSPKSVAYQEMSENLNKYDVSCRLAASDINEHFYLV